MNNLLWLIPVAPLIGAIINGKITMWYAHRDNAPNEKLVGLIGVLGPAVSFGVAVALFMQMRGMGADERMFTQVLFPWIVAGPVNIEFGLMVDALSIIMVLVVSGIGSIIHIYSVGYMHGDRGFARYFTYLNLFMFSMLMLVMGKNLLMLFVGWEGVGLCSYLLIGFWYKDIINAAAGKKAFIVNRIGDFAFLIGMFLIFTTTGELGHSTLDFIALRELVSEYPEAFAASATAICLLLFIGATGKSAQIPLFVWLPDAMAGPTPVSALIHAATMVTAGVYMIARMSFLYLESPLAMTIVAVVGVLTAIFAASIGIAQRDIKKVLAYSTISQLGYMFAAVGVGAFSAGIFHLMTHAFFKALLFLGSGSVIHAMSGEQDMFKMGALGGKMKITSLTFVIGSLAIAGIPIFSGFFSKDEILWYTFTSHLSPSWLSGVLWALLLVGAGVTAFYMFRTVFLTFYGERRYSDEAAAHLHESPALMTVPLIILAIGATIAGFAGVPAALGGSNWLHHWLAPALGPIVHHGAEQHAEAATHGDINLERILMVVSVVVALIGIVVAWRFYIKVPSIPAAIEKRFPGVYRLIYNKYYIDDIYQRLIVDPGYWLSNKVLYRIVDVVVIDGTVNGVGLTARIFGSALRMLQNGLVRTYALFLLIGVLFLLYKILG